jgi:hypothetical protein
MDVDDRRTDAIEEVARQDLHVAREHDEVAASAQQLEQARLGLRLRLRRDRHMVERQAIGLYVRAQVLVVGRDQDDLRVELLATPAPQQLLKAVVLARDEDRDALAHRGVPEPPVHGEALAHGGEVVCDIRAGARELHPQEERPAGGIGGVLVRAHDVRARVGEESGDRADDPGTVRTRRDEADRGHGGSVFRRPRLDFAYAPGTNRLRDP